MKPILDGKDLDTRLHHLYCQRELLEFLHSSDYFHQQAIAIWQEWLKYETPTSGPDGIEELDTPEFHKACWELDNNYYREQAL